jgi:hypothetical protein
MHQIQLGLAIDGADGTVVEYGFLWHLLPELKLDG